jgi:hypothetical protein
VSRRGRGAADQPLSAPAHALGDVHQPVIPAHPDAEVDPQLGQGRLLIVLAQRKITQAGLIGDQGLGMPQRLQDPLNFGAILPDARGRRPLIAILIHRLLPPPRAARAVAGPRAGSRRAAAVRAQSPRIATPPAPD